jgi:predicted nucleic-acid-binding protein
MTGLDTNVLARYYIAGGAEAATAGQREAARRLLESGQPLRVSKTVVLELEWVMRGYYRFSAQDISRVLHHLLGLAHVTVEDRAAVTQALANFEAGLDFADALHHASYRDCDRMASFDGRRFASRVKRLGLTPRVVLPA